MTVAVTSIPTHFCPGKVVKRNYINIYTILFNLYYITTSKLMYQYFLNISLMQ